ncbi:MAG: alpha/beta hydrolase family protein [Promethearchaeota archaeon]
MMDKKVQMYLFLRTVSTILGVFIIIVNLKWWNIGPSEIYDVPAYLLNLALLLGFQTFLFVYLGFSIAREVSVAWWNRWKLPAIDCIERSPVEIFQKGDVPGVVGRDAIEGYLYQRSLPRSDSGKESFNQKDDKMKVENGGADLVIISYGFNDSIEKSFHFINALVIAGFRVFCWNYKGIGKSHGRITKFQDHISSLKNIIVYWSKILGSSGACIHLCGWSLGGMVSLIAGLDNDKVKGIFAWSTWSDLKRRVLWRVYLNPIALIRYAFKGKLFFIGSKVNEMVSPLYFIRDLRKKYSDTRNFHDLVSNKVFLCHARDDRLVSFPNFRDNMEALELDEKNYFIFNSGGHLLLKKEAILLGLMLEHFTRSKARTGDES